MTPLELKRIDAELARVIAARKQLELNVDERMEEIGRLKENIKVQEAKEQELSQKITESNK